MAEYVWRIASVLANVSSLVIVGVGVTFALDMGADDVELVAFPSDSFPGVYEEVAAPDVDVSVCVGNSVPPRGPVLVDGTLLRDDAGE